MAARSLHVHSLPSLARQLHATVTSSTLTQRPGRHHVALGTDDGGVVILATLANAIEPVLTIALRSSLLPVLLDHRISAEAGPLQHAAWSLDGRRLLTLSAKGTLVCWAFNTAETAFGTEDLNPSLAPVPVHALSAQELQPQQGPFAVTAAAAQPPLPLVGAFFPSFTVLGGQPAVALGFDNGDVMVCTLEPSWHAWPRLDKAALGATAQASFASDSIPVELFRGAVSKEERGLRQC